MMKTQNDPINPPRNGSKRNKCRVQECPSQSLNLNPTEMLCSDFTSINLVGFEDKPDAEEELFWF